MARAPRSVAPNRLNDPLKLPSGVRTALTMTASFMTIFSYLYSIVLLEFSIQKRKIFHKLKEIEKLSGDVLIVRRTINFED
jgi:hypothetical protein